MRNVIAAQQALEILATKTRVCAVDVRSEDEFAKGAIPNFVNIPILDNRERHEVGICYKQNGQQAAIELGHKLVDNHREKLIEQWASHLQGAEWPLLACWRGGLRSETAAQWLESDRVMRVEGGTKAMRNEFLNELENPPPFYVVSGPTGSQKTQLIEQSGVRHVNLEQLARHRGSAFGSLWKTPQPSQITFENEIGFALLKLRLHVKNDSSKSTSTRILIEDESRAIGYVQLPDGVINQIKTSPVIRLTVDIEKRIDNILNDYVVSPLESGLEPVALFTHYEACLFRIQKRLGGQAHSRTLQIMKGAFEKSDIGLHREWIRLLLENYYDKAYHYGESILARDVAFEGNWNECLAWIKNQSP